MRKLPAALCAMAIAVALSCTSAFAGGALAFLSTPSVVHSGEPNSWMNVYSDCPGGTMPCPTGAGSVALPTHTAPVDVTTQRTASELVFRFSIPDKTPLKEGPTSLDVGDTIVVQIDPDGSRGATLGMGGTALTTDYRYEIKIVDNQLNRVRRREPTSGTVWGLATNWCGAPNTALPQSCAHATNGTVTLSAVAPAYVVELRIPLASIGSPSNDFGLAIGFFNDLGHADASGTPNLSAVTFPFGDMPADTENAILDPGVTDVVAAGGAWVTPASWGTGYVSTPASNPGQLTLGHNPQPWVADAIKLSFCDTGRWEDIGVADTSLNQTGLANWYLYERDDPCKMGVWVRVNNSLSTAASAKLLVMWADGGLATNSWRVVALTPAISFGPGASTFRVVWDKVPSKGSVPGGTTHPCLRVYLLPTTLNHSDPTSGALYDDAAVQAINSETKLAQFERAYGFPPYPWNSQVAQMNFTNIASGANPVCSRLPNCKQPMIITDLQQFLLATIESLGPRPAYAQPKDDRFVARPIKPGDRTDWPKPKYPMVILSVQGFTVPDKATSKRPYLFVQNIGGVAWAMDERAITGKSVTVGFTMTVPAILYRDFSSRKVKELRAQPRKVLLFGKVSGREGDKKVQIKFDAPTKAIEPGKAQRASVAIKGT